MTRGLLIVGFVLHSWCSLICSRSVQACEDAAACEAVAESSCCCCCEETEEQPAEPRPTTCCIIAEEPLGLPPKAPRLAVMPTLALPDAACGTPFELRPQIAATRLSPWLTDRGAGRTLAFLCVWNN